MEAHGYSFFSSLHFNFGVFGCGGTLEPFTHCTYANYPMYLQSACMIVPQPLNIIKKFTTVYIYIYIYTYMQIGVLWGVMSGRFGAHECIKKKHHV